MLDPDPKVMRTYSSYEDTRLLPDGSNISAAVFELKQDAPEAFGRLEELVRTVTGGCVTGLDFVETEIGDVQLLLHETVGTELAAIPARLASDGTLRMLAFATAILTTPYREGHEGPERLIVIEEVERGLYPAQARTLLELMERELEARAASVLLTTHSPTLLEALDPKRHADVIVCSRTSDSGRSRLDRLTDLPGYAELIAAGGLGEAVIGNGLEQARGERPKNAREFFNFLETM